MNRITEEAIAGMRKWATPAAAAAYDHRVRVIESETAGNFAEIGLIVKEVDDRELWRFITKSDGEMCHSFDDWLLDAMPVSRSQAYSARKVAQRLDHLSAEERAEISPGNLKTLAEVDDPKITKSRPILDAAKKMKPKEFRAKIAREHPEQHLESFEPMRFNPVATARELIDRALEKAKELDGAVTREEQLECLADFYLQARPDAEIVTVKAVSESIQ